MVFCTVDYFTIVKKFLCKYMYAEQLETMEDLLSAHGVTWFVKTLKYH